VVLLGAANSIHLQRWALALHGRGRRISVVSQQAAQALPLPPEITLHGLPVRSGAGYLLNAWPLRRLLARLQPDLLHAHYASGYGTLARLAGWRPTLLSVWGSDVYEFPARGLLQAWQLRGNLRAAQALASTSQAMADQVRRVWPAAGPIAITPFGVDMAMFSPAAEPALARPSDPATDSPTELANELAKDRPLIIGTVKTLEPTYGIDLLLLAFAALRQRLPGVALGLRVVGGGPQRQALEALSRSLGIAAAVEFTGPVAHAEVPARLRQLDIYVAPSRHESFGVAVVEAMACGLPVVVSDAGGLPEVVDDGGNGLVVASGSVPALVEALARLVGDPALRARMASASRQRALALYDWPGCVDRMIECQQAVMAAHAATHTPATPR
jgi:glycosyltransferase involved in cell wall biosynthesis